VLVLVRVLVQVLARMRVRVLVVVLEKDEEWRTHLQASRMKFA
jgi:hypothetical protein